MRSLGSVVLLAGGVTRHSLLLFERLAFPLLRWVLWQWCAAYSSVAGTITYRVVRCGVEVYLAVPVAFVMLAGACGLALVAADWATGICCAPVGAVTLWLHVT
jgi:hypothetical protein